MNEEADAEHATRPRGHPFLLIGIVSLTTGAASVGGSMLGAGLGQVLDPRMRLAGLFTGAVIGGFLGVALAIRLAARVGALPRSRISCWFAFVGGAMGFAMAVVLVPRHLHGPLVPMACALLPGVGAALSARIASKGSGAS